MKVKENRTLLQGAKGFIAYFFAVCLLVSTLFVLASAEVGKTDVSGKVYDFGKKAHYKFHKSKTFSESNEENTYGSFFVEGNISNIGEKDGVPSYVVSNGNLAIYYNYGDEKLNADKDSWHLAKDKSKKVADLKLDSKIMKGAIIVQTSKDGKTWTNDVITCDAFSKDPVRTDPFGTTREVHLINGSYYRVIVAYTLQIRTKESKFLFFNTDKYDTKKFAEVYEFYAKSENSDMSSLDTNQTYNLGSKVKAKDADGYSGEKEIGKSDIHYGWDLGAFSVNGFTDKVIDAEGKATFLKNVGDKVALWFKLNDSINSLNGNNKLTITADTAGYDQYFQTEKTDFGRGALIIRHTDHNNVKSEPTIYKNYLEANASAGADTQVQLFEEGDYEVALNYKVTKDGLLDKTGNYRIFFKFSVRNGNCMVYPFDVLTNGELTNSSMTENGFRLDLAKSRYLKINIKREVMTDSAYGLTEDTRFNGPAKDGAQYTEEGVYTITARNEYTDQVTVKKIYVGDNNILRAHVSSGLPISEINKLIKQGAQITETGLILIDGVPVTQDSDSENQTGNDDENEKKEKSKAPIIIFVILSLLVLAAVAFIFIKKQKGEKIADTFTAAKPELEPEKDNATEIQTETVPEAESSPEAETESESKPEIEPETESKSESGTKSEGDGEE